MNNSLNNGKHILAELYNCQCSDDVICSVKTILPAIRHSIIKAGLTIVGEAVHEFQAQDDTKLQLQLTTNQNNDNHRPNSNVSSNTQTSGYTISMLLAESHVCLHTWGELKTVTLDIYVCNFLQDNSDKADELLQACQALFQPEDVDIKTLWRTHNLKNNE